MRVREFIGLPLFAIAMSGCGLVATEIDGKVTVEFDVNGDDGVTSWAKEFPVDTNSNDDIKNNRDRLVEGTGTIREVRLEIVQVSGNAKFGSGEAFVRTAGGAWPMEPYATFVQVPLIAGNNFKLSLNADRRAALADLVFDKNNTMLDVKFEGTADQAPARFKAKVIFHVEAEAGL